ncbi:unnamed protein product [marine sediment metagenome]|uniref:Glycinamide ribonucleotide synthetase n=1 Tax=marine sediment metagenome TaxID=412755 RepID=X1CEJ5_9ZZZZ
MPIVPLICGHSQYLFYSLQSDLIELCQKTTQTDLKTVTLKWDPRPTLGVVLAAAGYPATYATGAEIHGLQTQLPNCKVFQAGTCTKNNKTLTNGGRVLCVTAIADNLKAAQTLAYEQVQAINWEGMFYRADIGFKAIK